MVSHAGSALLRELATETGLAGAVSGALLDTYRGVPVHMPGQVFADLAVAIADGADAVTGIEVLRDREALFGPVASMPTAWRLLDRIDAAAPAPGAGGARRGRARRAWEAGAAPEPGGELRIDFDATISIAHSEKENAAATWKKTFGFHPLLAFLDRPEVAGGEGLAGLLRPGNAGSNTAADHVTVLDLALEALPEPRPAAPGRPCPRRGCWPAPIRPGPRTCSPPPAASAEVGSPSGSPSMSASSTIVGLIPGAVLAPGHRRRRAARRRLGGRGHRHDRPAAPGRRARG